MSKRLDQSRNKILLFFLQSYLNSIKNYSDSKSQEKLFGKNEMCFLNKFICIMNVKKNKNKNKKNYFFFCFFSCVSIALRTRFYIWLKRKTGNEV